MSSQKKLKKETNELQKFWQIKYNNDKYRENKNKNKKIPKIVCEFCGKTYHPKGNNNHWKRYQVHVKDCCVDSKFYQLISNNLSDYECDVTDNDRIQKNQNKPKKKTRKRKLVTSNDMKRTFIKEFDGELKELDNKMIVNEQMNVNENMNMDNKMIVNEQMNANENMNMDNKMIVNEQMNVNDNANANENMDMDDDMNLSDICSDEDEDIQITQILNILNMSKTNLRINIIQKFLSYS